ncbi:MAG: hypothetical protein ACXQT2_01515 [Methanotrichaceae archaeon]
MSSKEETPILEVPIAPPVVPPQLQALIAAEVARQIEPLLGEIAALEATNAVLVDRLATLEGLSAPPVDATTGDVHSPQQDPSAPESVLLEEIIQLRADMEELNDLRALEIGQDRQRLAALEVPEVPPPGPKTTGHIQHIRGLLRKADFHRSTVKFLASRLGLTKRRTWQIVHQMEEERIVNLVWDPHHKGRKLVELRQQIGTRSEM